MLALEQASLALYANCRVWPCSTGRNVTNPGVIRRKTLSMGKFIVTPEKLASVHTRRDNGGELWHLQKAFTEFGYQEFAPADVFWIVTH
jgi:hypothetical protein